MQVLELTTSKLYSFNLKGSVTCSGKWILFKYHSTTVISVMTARAPSFLSLDTQELLPHWAVNLINFYCIAPLNIVRQLKDIATIALRNLLLHMIAQQLPNLYQKMWSRNIQLCYILQQNIFLKLGLQPGWMEKKVKCFHHYISLPRLKTAYQT